MEREVTVFEVEAHVATLTLNRPEKLNTFNNQMALEVEAAWIEVRENDDIRVVVLQANGERAFSNGVDVKTQDPWFRKTNVWNTFDPGITLSPKLHHRVWKPVIAAVHGMCASAAQYFVNEADIIICAEDTEFFDAHSDGGFVSALEPMGMLARGVPIGDVLRWALMGSEERITANTALRIGLVTEVVPNDLLRERAREIAVSIARREPKAVQGTVRAIWESLDMTRSMAQQNGMAYTLIGNIPPSERGPQKKGGTPSYR